MLKMIPGIDSIYRVSENGQVINTKTGKTISAHICHKGYFRTNVISCGKNKLMYVHRLVALAFIGEPENEFMQVNHKDGNKQNNHFSNLEWVTPKENVQHFYEELDGIKTRPRGFGNVANALFTDDEIRRIRGMSNAGISATKIAEEFDNRATPSTIQYISIGKNYAHVDGVIDFTSTNVIKNNHKRGKNHHNSVYSDDEIRSIRSLRASGVSYQKIADAHGNKSSWASIKMIIDGKTYSHVI